MQIAKAHAYGNDFLLLREEDVGPADFPALARDLCARHTGLGADGLIGYTARPDESARMRLANADGSHSEVSGNGVRCLAAMLLHQGALGGPRLEQLSIVTDAGIKSLQLLERDEARYTFRAAMGTPLDVTQERLLVAGEALQVVTLNMGNPQCVLINERLPDPERFAFLGPRLATHARFPEGSNVEFATLDSPDRVSILIWERGVGPTTASGTGACAAAVAAIAFGGAAREVSVTSSGGTQRVLWQDAGVYLTGWAEILFIGEWLRPTRPHREISHTLPPL